MASNAARIAADGNVNLEAIFGPRRGMGATSAARPIHTIDGNLAEAKER
jgi:hypothetical protein